MNHYGAVRACMELLEHIHEDEYPAVQRYITRGAIIQLCQRLTMFNSIPLPDIIDATTTSNYQSRIHGTVFR